MDEPAVNWVKRSPDAFGGTSYTAEIAGQTMMVSDHKVSGINVYRREAESWSLVSTGWRTVEIALLRAAKSAAQRQANA
jgi:hypothetical protein